jgi:iron complex outermembrane receptor protein
MTRVSMGLLSGVSVGVLAVASLVSATAVRAAEPTLVVSLPSGPLQASLVALANQADIKILFETNLVAQLQAPALQGRFTARQALDRLLSGSYIAVDEVRPGVMVLRPARVAISGDGAPGDDGLLQPQAQGEVTAEPPQQLPEAVMVSEVVVGTHIRGVKDSASPVVIIGREDIDRAGYASVADALAALPQAFGGTYSEDSSSTGADPIGANAGRGTGVNLRGLGANATLVLVDGRRMAGAGARGDFADVSSIPMVALERVEVLLDGASALYGSDAVGGVVNIRLRRSLDGGDFRASGGVATEGGYSRYQFGQALGRTWSSGHVLAAYEYYHHSELAALDRRYVGDADLRALGGSDRRRDTYSQPGNILRLNVAGSYVPTYAIPGGQNGIGLTPADFVVGSVNRENQRASFWVLPKQSRHSFIASISQDVGEAVTLSADARIGRRDYTTKSSGALTNLTVTKANPFYVSPTGLASERVAYSFMNEAGGIVIDGHTESLAGSVGADVRLPAGWAANLYGAYAQELSFAPQSNQLNSTFLNEAAGLVSDSPLTSFSAARDGYFNPFLGAGSNPKAVLDFVLSGRDVTKQRGETRSINLALDGPLFDLPGGPLRLAIGGQARREGLRTGGWTWTSGYAPTARATRLYRRTVASAYAEFNAPFVSAANARPGIERLELSVAGRFEHYDDAGSTQNPKIGIIWAPIQDLTAKLSWGTSFRGPSLPEVAAPYSISPTLLPYNGGNVPVLFYSGGNPDLKPETAQSWAATLDIAPRRIPGLKISGTLYETRFKNRIASPALDNIITALTSTELTPFVTFVNPTTSPADLARVTALVNDSHAVQTTVYDIGTYRAIIEARQINTGSLMVRGLDLQGSYATSLLGDPLAFDASLSWLMHYERKVTPTSIETELSGMAGYPADLRARASATWTHGALGATAGLNYLGDTYAVETGRRVKPWTTADLQLRFSPTRGVLGRAGATWSLTVQNLFDAAPPFYDSPLAIGYDPANADPIGRTVSVQLTKAW